LEIILQAINRRSFLEFFGVNFFYLYISLFSWFINDISMYVHDIARNTSTLGSIFNNLLANLHRKNVSHVTKPSTHFHQNWVIEWAMNYVSVISLTIINFKVWQTSPMEFRRRSVNTLTNIFKGSPSKVHLNFRRNFV